jgi:hypothetical protein
LQPEFARRTYFRSHQQLLVVLNHHHSTPLFVELCSTLTMELISPSTSDYVLSLYRRCFVALGRVDLAQANNFNKIILEMKMKP